MNDEKKSNPFGIIIPILLVAAVTASAYTFLKTDVYFDLPETSFLPQKDMTESVFTGTWISVGSGYNSAGAGKETKSFEPSDFDSLDKERRDFLVENGEYDYSYDDGTWDILQSTTLSDNGRAVNKVYSDQYFGTWEENEAGAFYTPIVESDLNCKKQYYLVNSILGTTPADLGYDSDCFLVEINLIEEEQGYIVYVKE